MGKRRLRISAGRFGHRLVDFPLSLFDFGDPGCLNHEQHTPVQLLASQNRIFMLNGRGRDALHWRFIGWLVEPTKTSNKSGGEASYACSSHGPVYY